MSRRTVCRLHEDSTHGENTHGQAVLTPRFKYTRDNKAVTAASMLPMAHNPFVQFLSLSGAELRQRLDGERDKIPMFWITFVPNGQGDVGTECDGEPHWFPEDYHKRGRGRVKIGGPLAWQFRCK